jgi:general secretion pathway protein E
MPKNLIQIIQTHCGVSDEQLEGALKIQAEKGGRIGIILKNKKIITENQLSEAFSIQYGIPFQPDLPLDNFGSGFAEIVPIQFLKKFVMVPLETDSDTPDESSNAEASPADNSRQTKPPDHCTIAINDPIGFHALDDLVRLLNLKTYELVFSTSRAILAVINITYDLNRDSAQQLVQDMEDDESIVISDIEDNADLLDDTNDAPIIRLVNHIISQASKARASDIHIEPYQDSFKVRYRVDGILYDLLTPPKRIQAPLTSRIKVMSKLNIAEKRLPQDGRFDVKIGVQEIDVRVSTLPTSFGERVVLRLLNKSGSFLELSELGLIPERLAVLQKLVKTPNGIILMTGPTGSGKTTTLYAILSSINKPDINIITVEDPIEYRLQGISQLQVNAKIDLTFARGLRSIVRQDPDVILIGEIRDKETADIAVQSALTGHLVFSTLHTNDSASAITRLVDIGVEPFLISSSVVAVAAQRLVRVLCNECKTAYSPGQGALETLGISKEQIAEKFPNPLFYKAQGCEHCFNTGYKGRLGIFEIMVLNDSLKSLLLKTHDSNQIKLMALEHGMITLHHDGIHKVLNGITTMEEVLRVTQQ